MEIGDLVHYQGQRWMVASYDRLARLMTLFNQANEKREVPREFDRTHKEELQVIAHPSEQWPMLAAPVKSGAGPFARIVEPGPPGRPERVLAPWYDWVPSDFSREGGSFFVRPELRLLPGVLLLVTHKSGAQVRVVIPKTFGTVAHRKAMAKAKAVATGRQVEVVEPNRFSRLLKDDDDDNEA